MKASTIARAFAALQVAEMALNKAGLVAEWSEVMKARVALQFALDDMPPVTLVGSTEPAPVPDHMMREGMAA